jgi:hypothetical protein
VSRIVRIPVNPELPCSGSRRAGPINLRVFGWDEEHGDPSRWRRLRRRWDRLHSARIALDTAGFALITRSAVRAGR